jgi:protein SCO1
VPVISRRVWLAGAGALAVIAAAGTWQFQPFKRKPVGQVGGPFDLIDSDGAAFTFQDIQGKPSLVYFGFTRCPDICPTTLFRISDVLKRLGPDADQINALFITVDPDRDTPSQMKSYLSAFDPHLRGLTGDAAHLSIAWDAFGVEAEVVPTSSDNYNMDHTSKVFVLDRAGRFSSGFDMDTPPDTAVALIRALLG